MRICIDIRLLARRVFWGIPAYSYFLVDEFLNSVTARDNFTLFYNAFKKAPLPDSWKKSADIVEKSWPNRLLDLSLKVFGEPRLDRFIEADAYFSPHFNNMSLNNQAKRVITIHDLSFMHHPDFFSPRQKFWHWLQNYKRQIKEAGRLIAVSDFTKSDLINYFSLAPEKVARIYSGINPLYKKLPENNSEILKFKKTKRLNDPFIFYLGLLESRKNIGILIDAFNLLKQNAKFKSFKLILAGGFGWGSDKIFSLAKNSRFAKDIKFLGPVSMMDSLYLYNLAEIFVYPSFFEGFGFPPLEAQSCGVPVIASNRASLPEILGNSALLIEPWKTGELVSAVENIVLNPGVKKKFIALGFKNIKRFDWKKTAQETLSILHATSA
ncbi:MAG: glycosyltransferase family 4 protein [Candidatus Brennerbacteria bacterium]|nr:glycosyltransferase family 4 protein [Candidatus Brennerbacteria bacterium]